MNSICLNITPITRTSKNVLIFSTPTMAKYLEICLFISTKALKCIMVLEKAIKIYLWASQGALVGLSAWPGVGVAAWRGTLLVGECCLDLGTSFSVSTVAVRILGIGVSGSRLSSSFLRTSSPHDAQYCAAIV